MTFKVEHCCTSVRVHESGVAKSVFFTYDRVQISVHSHGPAQLTWVGMFNLLLFKLEKQLADQQARLAAAYYFQETYRKFQLHKLEAGGN